MAVTAAAEWRRTSPVSFIVRAITGLGKMIVPALAMLFGAQGWDGGGAFIVPAILAMVLISALFTWIAWRQFRYRIGDSDIRVEHGLLSRTARSVPYERIQDVSLEQKFVPRLFGMVEVRFETGAGGKDELKIAYVGAAEGAALRETVRTLQTGAPAIAGETAPPDAEPARTLFAMDLRRLLTFGVFEFSLVIFAVLGGVAQQLDFLLPLDIWDFDTWGRLLAGPGHDLAALGVVAQALGVALALATLALLGLGTGIARTVLRDYGFLLEETPKGLRRRRGLLTRTDVVMPMHRVQALMVTTGIVRRRFGWHGLGIVSLAQDAKSESHVVAPFATMEEIAPVVAATGFSLPDDGVRWHRASPRQRTGNMILAALLPAVLAVVAAVVGAAFASQTEGPPPAWPVLAPAGFAALGGLLALREWFLWRHRRHAVDARQLYVREGWLAPRLDIASRIRIQSVEIAQGPIARRRGYADVRFGLAGGTLEMHGVPIEGARAIRSAVLDSIGAVDFSRLPG